MTPLEFKATRRALGLSQEEIADLLGVGQNTVSTWETAKAKIPHAASVLMTAMLLEKRGRKVNIIHLCET